MKDTWTKPKGVGSRVGGEDGGEWWGKMETTVLGEQYKKLQKEDIQVF